MDIISIDKLKEYPVIDRNILSKLFGYTKNYSSLVLQRLEKRKILSKIIKGKYTLSDDINKLASNLYYPSYISFLTASMLKGCTEQIINAVQVISTKNKKFEFKNYNVELIKVKKDYIFGYDNENGTFIAENEKLLIDMLVYRNYSGNFNEIIKVVDTLDFDIKKIIAYLKRINSNSLIKRLGYLLEHYKKIDLHDNFKLDSNYVELDKLSKGKTTNSKWRLKL